MYNKETMKCKEYEKKFDADEMKCYGKKGMSKKEWAHRALRNCDTEEEKEEGTSAFRKTYSSKTYYAGGAEFESIVQGHSPDVAKKHYLDNDGLDMDEAVKILDAIGL